MSKKIISTKDAPAAIGPYSQAVQAGPFLFCSGQIPLVPSTGLLVSPNVKEQAEQVLQNVIAVLKAGGATLDHVVKSTIFLKSMGDFATVNEVYGSYFKANPPARSTVEVARLPKDVLVEIEVLAYLG